MQKLDNYQAALDSSIKNRLTLVKTRFDQKQKAKQLLEIILKTILYKKENLRKIIAHLKDLNPQNLLKQGYSILFAEKDNSIILSTEEAKQSKTLIAQLSDGKIKVNVCHGKSVF